MNHSFLKEIQINEQVECVYHVFNRDASVGDIKFQTASNGNPYAVFLIEDASLSQNDYRASAYYFYKNEEELSFLREGSEKRTFYVYIEGVCISSYPRIKIQVKRMIPAGNDSNLVFDTGNLYSYSEYYKNKLLDQSGLNTKLTHTSSQEFQDNYDLIEVGSILNYERIHNSPHDRYQINVLIDGIDEKFNIPAYLTPTIAKLIDDGYSLTIKVVAIPGMEGASGYKAGIRVNIKANK